MTEEMKALLYMVKSLITGDNNENIDYQSLNWSEMFSIACRNNIAPLLYDQVIEINRNICIEQSIIQRWKQCTMQTSLSEYRKCYALRQILNKAKENEISAVLFKGPILADLYHNYALRGSCDTDILIKESEKEAIFRIVEELGYQPVQESEENVYTFYNENYNHTLELHNCLYAAHKGPRIDLLKTMGLTNDNRLIQIEACGISVTTLGYEEQLIYLMFHMLKHFTLEGILLRHLIDIVLYINKYIDKISLDEFWTAMDALGYTSCCKVFFAVGIKYMGLNPRILGKRADDENRIYDDLLVDIFNFGIYKGKRRQSYQLAGVMGAYMVGNKKGNESQVNMYLKFLKPTNKKYEYAQRHKILLPVSWIHKLGRYLYSKYILKNGLYSPRERVKVTEDRIQLLQEVGLIEKVQ